MATQTFTRLVDDLDGSKAERTVNFSFDGREYCIDLSKKNIAALEKALRPFVEAAQPAKRKTGRRSPRRQSNASNDLAAVREWARENGHQVSDRGRISADIRAAYEAAR